MEAWGGSLVDVFETAYAPLPMIKEATGEEAMTNTQRM